MDTMAIGVFKRALQLLVCLLCCDILFCRDYCFGRFQNCICTDEDTECHRESNLTDITVLLPYVKDDAKSVVVTGSYIRELYNDALDACKSDTNHRLSSLKLLDLSNNRIAKIHRNAFICMPSLEELVLSQNDWLVDSRSQGVSPGHFKHVPNLQRLDLANAFSDEARNWTVETNLASIFENMDAKKLEILVLSHNELTTLSSKWVAAICSMASLKTLDLSHNKLITPGILSSTTEHCLNSLESLDLSFNNIPWFTKYFSENVVSLKNLKSLRLGHNSYVCNCNLLETFEWLRGTEIEIDRDATICAAGNPSLADKPILSLQREELCPSITGTSKTVEANESPVFPEVKYQECRDLIQRYNSTNAMSNETVSSPTLVRCVHLLNSPSVAAIHAMSWMFWIVLGAVLMI